MSFIRFTKPRRQLESSESSRSNSRRCNVRYWSGVRTTATERVERLYAAGDKPAGRSANGCRAGNGLTARRRGTINPFCSTAAASQAGGLLD